MTSSSAVSALAASEHEQVVFCRHQPSGLRAIIAVHSTTLGPGLGGTRFYPYASEDDAVADVLNLSRAMTYKNALAGLDHGGAKAVIIGDPTRDKTEALLRAYGRFIASLGGRYVTACDIGTYVEDMDIVARETRWVTGRSPADHGAGDSSVLTAAGVFQGMRAAAAHRWGEPTLAGRRVGVSGVGKVGAKLTALLVDDGAQVVVQDVSTAAVQSIQAAYPSVEAVDDVAALLAARLDVFAPCALGGAVDSDAVATLAAGGTCQIVCGAANNQLADPTVADELAAAGLLYAPDYLVNSGGVIQVADELHGFSEARARSKAMQIFQTMTDVLSTADTLGITPDAAAAQVAERRIAQVSGVGTIMVPSTGSRLAP